MTKTGFCERCDAQSDNIEKCSSCGEVVCYECRINDLCVDCWNEEDANEEEGICDCCGSHGHHAELEKCMHCGDKVCDECIVCEECLECRRELDDEEDDDE